MRNIFATKSHICHYKSCFIINTSSGYVSQSLFWAIMTAVLLFLPAISHADAENIFRENSKAVVVVISYDSKGNSIGQGSGFVVREDGVIVTNYHVISNAKAIKIKAGDKIFEINGLVYIDKENDVVMLKTDIKKRASYS